MSNTLSKESYLKIRNQLLRQNGRLQSEIKRLESLRANGQLSECGLESLTRLKTTIETREDIIDRFDEPFGEVIEAEENDCGI